MALIDDCKYYYKFDESSGDAIDSVGNIDGDVNGVTQGAEGIINTGYSFDGTSDWVQVNGITCGADHTISMWIKATTNPSSWQRLFSSASNIILAIDENSTGYLAYYDGGGWKKSNGDVCTGAWVHVVAVNDGEGGLKMFANNSNIYDSSGDATAISGNAAIGAYHVDQSLLGFVGLIDEVGIWDRNLSDAEVEELYNSGSGLSYPFSAAGTNCQINIGDTWKEVPSMQINVGDTWKAAASASINIGDAWKSIF